MQASEDNRPSWVSVLERASHGNRGRTLFKVVPYFFSALLFLSGLLAVAAPLPLLLMAHQQKQRDLGRLGGAVIFNAALVFALSKSVYQGAFFILTVAPIVMGIPVLFERYRYRFDRVVLLLWVGLMAGITAFVVGYSLFSAQMSPWAWMGGEIQNALKMLVEAGASLPQEMTEAELVQKVLQELPSALGLMLFTAAGLNTLLFLSWSRASYRQRIGFTWDTLSQWRAPEILVWPTLFVGAGVVFDAGWMSIVAANLLRLFLAVYAAQGLCILWTIFEKVGVKGGLRVFLLGVSAVFASPIVVGLGFFDLWIDFRAKFRQS